MSGTCLPGYCSWGGWRSVQYLQPPTLQQLCPCSGSSGSTPDDNDDDDKFEERIAALQGKRASKQRPASQGAAARVPGGDISAPASKPSPTPAVPKDWGKEEVFLDSPPHRGDLASNIALGATLLWLPLTAAAVGRAAFVRYLVTDKRVSVSTSAPWKSEGRCVTRRGPGGRTAADI